MLSVARASQPHGPAHAAGLTAEFLEREIDRVGATLSELRDALAFVKADVAFDPHSYDALSPRMRRLVDLVAVAGHTLSQKLCEAPRMAATG